MGKRSTGRRPSSFREQAAQLRNVRNSTDLEEILDEWEYDDYEEDDSKEEYRFMKD